MENDKTVEETKQCCGNCWWHDRNHPGKSLCYHDVSDFYQDITDDNFHCRKWVGIGKDDHDEA